MTYPALLAAALLAFSQAATADTIESQWRTLIGKDFKDGCITRLQPFRHSNGANGRRGAIWLVESCEGLFEYSTSYLPDAALVAKRLRQLPPMTPAQIQSRYY